MDTTDDPIEIYDTIAEDIRAEEDSRLQASEQLTEQE
jgi:hypothetical protein